MKLILAIILALSFNIRAGNFSQQNTSNYIFGANCSYTPDPYTFTDLETEIYAGLQIGAGAFALIFLSSNFVSAYYFYKKEAKKLMQILNSHIEAIKEQISIQKTANDELQMLVNEIDMITDDT